MSNTRRILIWMLPIAALLLIGLAVLWLRGGEQPADTESPRPPVTSTVEPGQPDLPVPGEPRDTRATTRPEPMSGGLTGRLVTPDHRPVQGQGRVEAARGANFGEPGLGTAMKLGISASLDGEGRFVLTGLPLIDSVVLRLEGESFALCEAGPYLVDVGTTRDLGDLIVQPGTNIVVSVLDPRGNPVANARVSLFQTPDDPNFDDQPHAATVTDERGLAHFPHARSGLFTVRAKADGFALMQTQDGPRRGEAPAEFQVVVSLVEPLALEGIVLSDADGEPIAGAQVDAVPIDPGLGGGRTLTGADGRFSIPDIAPGNYTVSARAKGYSPAHERNWSDRGPTEFEFRLKQQGRLRGTVIGADGETITAFDVQPRWHRRLQEPAFPRQNPQRIVSAQGEFQLEDLEPGFWCIEVWAQGYGLTVGPCVKVAQGRDVGGLVIQLARGATLKGTVVDTSGAPVAGARVSLHDNFEPDAIFLRDTEPSAALGAETRTDAQGRFELHELAARAFQVQVDHRDFAIVRRDDVRAEAGREVEVAPFVLTRAGAVSGKAVSSQGDPLSGVTVHLYLVGAWTHQAVSDGQGVFRFERLPEGDYELSCYGRNPNLGAMIAAVTDPDKPPPFRVESGERVVQNVVAFE